MKREEIINAYVKIRKIDNTIPDDVLDFMKDSALSKLTEIQEGELKLDMNDSLGFVFHNEKGEKEVAQFSISKIIELVEDEAYETVTTPFCESSTCAVNNFCECEPENEDVGEIKEVFLEISRKDLVGNK